MTTYSTLRLDNGSKLEHRSNVGAKPKFFLNGTPITKEVYDALVESNDKQKNLDLK
jgi:hypothetical protein